MDENLNLNANKEIEEALKKFEETNVEQTPKNIPNKDVSEIHGEEMSNIKFETDNLGIAKNNNYEKPTPKMTDFVIKHSGGLIKNQKQAEYFLLIFAIISIIISMFLFFGGKGNTSQEVPAIISEQVKQMPR